MTASGTSEAGYIALSEVVEEVLVLRREMQNFIELSMGILHVRRRPGPGHDLVRDACNTGEVRVVCCKSLEIQKFNKHAKTVPYAVI